MDNFLGVDSQVAETLRLMGNGWIYAFFIIGGCLLAASWLVNWQVRKAQNLMARQAEDGDDTGKRRDGRGQTPRS